MVRDVTCLACRRRGGVFVEMTAQAAGFTVEAHCHICDTDYGVVGRVAPTAVKRDAADEAGADLVRERLG